MSAYENRLVSTKFVGGPEDGNYLMVYDYADTWQVEGKRQPKVTPCYGAAPCADEFKIFTYVRRGGEMVIV